MKNFWLRGYFEFLKNPRSRLVPKGIILREKMGILKIYRSPPKIPTVQIEKMKKYP
jgi:hypothetical protein